MHEIIISFSYFLENGQHIILSSKKRQTFLYISYNLDGTTKYKLVSATIWILQSNRSWYPAQSGWYDQVRGGISHNLDGAT